MKEETLQKIEQYLAGDLTGEELQLFESALKSDEELASFFTTYKAVENEMPAIEKNRQQEETLKKNLQRLGAIHFAKNDEEKSKQAVSKIIPVENARQPGKQATMPDGRGRSSKLLYFSMIAAAACVVIFLGWYFLFTAPSGRQLAQRYVEENMQTLSPSLTSKTDSIELGKIAFNNKNYGEAEKIFGQLAGDKNTGTAAIQYLGTVYLVTHQYDQAINQFELLGKDSSLHANFGFFYQAIALIRRNKTGDTEKAKIILQYVISNDLPGRQEAETWLNKLN